ncbi:MAG: hypothetical protein HQK49_02795 [Oligoflexia bacterium]|nr:hypothetical protein [Oligoflexia bacterium]
MSVNHFMEDYNLSGGIMTLSAIDYSKDLAKEKAEYQRSIRDSSEAHKKDMERMQKMHDTREKIAKENYYNAKLNTEDQFTNQMDDIKEQNQKIIERLHEEYPRKLAVEREQFQNTAEEQKKGFRREIDTITDALRRANMYERDEHEAVQRNSLENNRQRLDSMNKQHIDQVKYIKEDAQKTEDASKQKRIEENEKINSVHQLQMNDLRKSETTKRMDEVRNKENQLKIVKDEWDHDKRISEERHEDLLDSFKKKNEFLVEGMRDNFNKLAGNYREQMIKQDVDSKDTYQKAIQKMGDQYRKDVEVVGKKLQSVQKERSQMRLNPKMYEDKIYDQTMQNENNVRELNTTFNRRVGDIRDSYINDLEKTKEEDFNRENARVERLSDYVAESIAKKEQEKGKIIDLYRKKDKNQANYYDQFIQNISDNGEKRSKENVDKFNKSIEDLSKRTREAYDKLREHFGEKQREIVMKGQHDRAEIITMMRDQQNKKISQDNENHMKQLSSRDIKLQELEQNMNEKLEEKEKNRVLDERYKNVLLESLHKQNSEVVRRALENKDLEDKAKLDEVRKNFEDKIYELEKKNTAKVRQIASNSRREQNQMLLENFSKMKQLEDSNKREVNRLSNENEVKLRAVVSSYDSKIEQMRKAYEDQIEKLKGKISEKSEDNRDSRAGLK